MFPDAEFLGWYTVGSEPSEAEVQLHKQLLETNENPLLLTLDVVAAKRPTQKELPVAIYESELRIVNDTPSVLFNKVAYTIETNEAERIAVDHVAHLSSAGGGGDGSQSTAHLGSLRNAVQMLRERLVMIERYVERQQERAAANRPIDHAVLRKIGALSHSLPALETEQFNDEFFASFNDGALLSYLAAITKTIDQTNSLTDLFQLSQEGARAGGGHGMSSFRFDRGMPGHHPF